MNEPGAGSRQSAEFSREDMMSALFAQMVMQQSNLALMLLGKAPHPESGQTIRDLDGAKLFIDQLEMLEVKTRGNLTKPEEAFLKQSLMSLRLAFVEAVESPEPPVPPLGSRMISGGSVPIASVCPRTGVWAQAGATPKICEVPLCQPRSA